MLENIWMGIAIGHRVIKTLGALKNDVESFRSRNAMARAQNAQMEALDKRTGNLELLAKEQDDRLQGIENSLKDALIATEALAQRAGTIFGMAVAGCAVGVPAFAVSILALVLRR